MTVYDLTREGTTARGTWAWFSDDRAYRYRLGRRWSEDGPLDVWVMLNPSTADATVDDRTIGRCKAFSSSWGAAGIVVVNLFALISTDPAALLRHPDPIGPENDDNIAAVASRAQEDGGRVIAAWGAHKMAPTRAQRVARVVQAHADLLCLGTAKDGAPRHPLYLKGDTPLAPWAAR